MYNKEELIEMFKELSNRYNLGWGAHAEIANLINSAYHSGHRDGFNEAYNEIIEDLK